MPFWMVRNTEMLKALKYKDVLLEQFYLDSDDITIRRRCDGYHNRFRKHDVVTPYAYKGNSGYNYKGVHIPRTRDTISLPWLLTVLRKVAFTDGCVLDHIDGNVDNNSRVNLRVITQDINCKNKNIRKDSSTGYTGITKNGKSYTVRRTIAGKRKYLGSCSTLQEAITLIKSYDGTCIADGYTDRHLQSSATTIPKGSTLKRVEAVGS